MSKVTLKQIRNANSLDELKPGIKYLTVNMQGMAWGDFNAYRNTIIQKAKELGYTPNHLNELVEHWQIFGEWLDLTQPENFSADETALSEARIKLNETK